MNRLYHNGIGNGINCKPTAEELIERQFIQQMYMHMFHHVLHKPSPTEPRDTVITDTGASMQIRHFNLADYQYSCCNLCFSSFIAAPRVQAACPAAPAGPMDSAVGARAA